MKKLAFVSTLALALMPLAAHAQQLTNLQQLLKSIGTLVGTATPIVVGLALLAFFWGLVRYIFGGADKKDEAKSLMIWGIIALFVMTSVWGIVKFIGDQFNLTNVQSVVPPSVTGVQ